MSCEYCEKFKSLYWYKDEEGGNDWIREVYVEGDGSISVISQGDFWTGSEDSYPDTTGNASIEINFCPMCGRYLGAKKIRVTNADK